MTWHLTRLGSANIALTTGSCIKFQEDGPIVVIYFPESHNRQAKTGPEMRAMSCDSWAMSYPYQVVLLFTNQAYKVIASYWDMTEKTANLVNLTQDRPLPSPIWTPDRLCLGFTISRSKRLKAKITLSTSSAWAKWEFTKMLFSSSVSYMIGNSK